MAFRRIRKMTFNDLDSAKEEYEHFYQIITDSITKLNEEQELSLITIGQVEELAGSIKHTPIKIRTPLKKICHKKQIFIDSVGLKKQERKIISEGFDTLLADYNTFDNGRKDIQAVITLLGLFILSKIIKTETANEAARNTMKIKIALNELFKQQAKIGKLIIETQKQRNIVEKYYNNLHCYEMTDFLNIPENHRTDLISLMNHTQTLATMLKTKY